MMQLEAYSQRIYSKENSEGDKLKQNSFCNCISLTVFYPFLVSMEIMIFFFSPYQNKVFQFKPHADSGQLSG